MAQMISIVGYSDSGKTTLIEKLVPELKKRGYRVGTVKHALHEANLDTRGKDSWRHFIAGADTVVISSAEKIAMVKKRAESIIDSDAALASLEPYFADMDIVLVEGYKSSKKPKIEIFRSSAQDAPVCIDDSLLLALVTDAEIDCSAPRFGLDEIGRLADLVEQAYLKKRSS